MTLVVQPTTKPTRKIYAVILAGLVTAGLQTLLSRLFPGSALLGFINGQDLDIWIQGIVMAGAGYLARENILNVDAIETILEDAIGSGETAGGGAGADTGVKG
jgi:hypothetical protein